MPVNECVSTLVLILVAGVLGCAKPAATTAPATSDVAATDEHVHGEWWCDEHGVPEDICVLCDSDLAADFKAKGDWCEEHDRPDSQCFICHPEKQAEFAALYEAKYGKKPPAPVTEGDGSHEHHEHEEKS